MMDAKLTRALAAGVSLLQTHGVPREAAIDIVTNLYALGVLHGKVEATRGAAVENLRRLQTMEVSGHG